MKWKDELKRWIEKMKWKDEMKLKWKSEMNNWNETEMKDKLKSWNEKMKWNNLIYVEASVYIAEDLTKNKL